MAMREIRTVGDPVLRTPCDPITTIDARVRSLVEDLLETVDHDGRAGLAANQIGVGLRAFSWNIDDEIGYVLNPVIVDLSELTFLASAGLRVLFGLANRCARLAVVAPAGAPFRRALDVAELSTVAFVAGSPHEALEHFALP